MYRCHRCHRRRYGRQRTGALRSPPGFTLIEVMIVVAIVTILATIAYPSYTDYVIRGNIPGATAALATKQVQMEQFFQDRRSYVGGDLGTNAGIGGTQGCVPDGSTSKYFDFSCSGAGAPSATIYTISAVGKSSMAGFTYTIDQSGGKTSTVPTAKGWTTATPNNCWVTKKGGVC